MPQNDALTQLIAYLEEEPAMAPASGETAGPARCAEYLTTLAEWSSEALYARRPDLRNALTLLPKRYPLRRRQDLILLSFAQDVVAEGNEPDGEGLVLVLKAIAVALT